MFGNSPVVEPVLMLVKITLPVEVNVQIGSPIASNEMIDFAVDACVDGHGAYMFTCTL